VLRLEFPEADNLSHGVLQEGRVEGCAEGKEGRVELWGSMGMEGR